MGHTFDDPLKELPAKYYDSGDLRSFMEGSSHWILDQVRKRHTRDPDAVGDFYLYFYERARNCLESYKSRQDVPFTGFLAVYLRNEFFNFLRMKKTRAISQTSTEDISRTPDTENTYKDLHGRVLDVLREIPIDLRLVMKLHHGLDLNLEEMRALAENRTAKGAADVLVDMACRRQKIIEKTDRLKQRAAYLNHLIHSPRGTTEPARLRTWKNKIIERLSRPAPVFSYSELAKILGTSKTTIARKIENARNLLKGKDVWNVAV